MSAQLSYESRVELARLRANVRLNVERFRFPVVEAKDEWLPGITEPEDVGLQVTPEVDQWGGVTYLPNGMKFLPGDPFRPVPAVRKVAVPVTHGAERKRREMDDELFRYVTSRDPSEGEVLRRWNQPNDVLDELDAIEQADEREVWVERMTAFREAQLRRLLKDYFGGADYMNREIVLKWERKNGRWVPAQKMLVKEWVAQQIEQRGSRLAAFSACAGTLRSKITRRRISQDATFNPGWWQTYNKVGEEA